MRTNDSSSSRKYRHAAALAALAAIALAVAPVGQAANPRASDTTTEMHVGTINPTNIAIVSTDLEAAASLEEDDLEFATLLTGTEPTLTPEEQIQAPEANEIAMGDKVLVAVLDSGFNLEHPALVGAIGGIAYDAIDEDYDPTDLGDGIDNDLDGITDRGVGHGTFVAGMILRAAPNATILPIRVRDDEGWGTNDELVRGLEYAILMGANVINLSLDESHTKDSGLTNAMNEVSDLGIVIVVSAGNDGENAWKSLPKFAWNDGTLTIGAVDGSDQIAEFSNYTDKQTGRTAHIAFAPGVDLIGPYGAYWDDSYAVWSGTSFATGLASGAAALLSELWPDATGEEIVARLCETADPVTDVDGNELDAAGRINALGAVETVDE